MTKPGVPAMMTIRLIPLRQELLKFEQTPQLCAVLHDELADIRGRLPWGAAPKIKASVIERCDALYKSPPEDWVSAPITTLIEELGAAFDKRRDQLTVKTPSWPEAYGFAFQYAYTYLTCGMVTFHAHRGHDPAVCQTLLRAGHAIEMATFTTAKLRVTLEDPARWQLMKAEDWLRNTDSTLLKLIVDRGAAYVNAVQVRELAAAG